MQSFTTRRNYASLTEVSQPKETTRVSYTIVNRTRNVHFSSATNNEGLWARFNLFFFSKKFIIPFFGFRARWIKLKEWAVNYDLKVKQSLRVGRDGQGCEGNVSDRRWNYRGRVYLQHGNCLDLFLQLPHPFQRRSHLLSDVLQTRARTHTQGYYSGNTVGNVDNSSSILRTCCTYL